MVHLGGISAFVYHFVISNWGERGIEFRSRQVLIVLCREPIDHWPINMDFGFRGNVKYLDYLPRSKYVFLLFSLLVHN